MEGIVPRVTEHMAVQDVCFLLLFQSIFSLESSRRTALCSVLYKYVFTSVRVSLVIKTYVGDGWVEGNQ